MMTDEKIPLSPQEAGYMTVAEAAELIGVSVHTMRNYLSRTTSYELPRYRQAGQTYIKPDELLVWYAAYRTPKPVRDMDRGVGNEN